MKARHAGGGAARAAFLGLTVDTTSEGDHAMPPPPHRRVAARRSRRQALLLALVVGLCLLLLVGLSYELHMQWSAPKQLTTRELIAAKCYRTRDYGMLATVDATGRMHCQGQRSAYTHYDSLDASIRATVVTHWVLDLTHVAVATQIQNLSMDGGAHDPRFLYHDGIAHCVCAGPQTSKQKAPNVWADVLAKTPATRYTACKNDNGAMLEPSRRVQQNVVVMARRDDHNPFFQLAATLNAWVVVQMLGWDFQSTQLLYLDDAIQSPMHELQWRLLAPATPPIYGADLLGEVVALDHAVLAPAESTGPIMQHLDDYERCQRNQLVIDFRAKALAAMGVEGAKRNATSCTVTIISRRSIGGRDIERQWLNEDEVLARMTADYGSNCTFQSIDFADVALATQMQVMVESDMVIGMHGAGLANVLWTRPGTLVLEIFPRRCRRWGYRNLCQFVGCEWHQFRGGVDTGQGDRHSNKTIPYSEWSDFFHPIFRLATSKINRTPT